MGLDVTLTGQKKIEENGKTWSVWRKDDENGEWEEYQEVLYEGNITHNLGGMAEEAGIYDALWRPYKLSPQFIETDNYHYEHKQEGNITVLASDISPLIREGLNKMKADPEHYKKFDSPNGWGTYKHFVQFVEEYLEALEKYPNAIVTCDR